MNVKIKMITNVKNLNDNECEKLKWCNEQENFNW